MAKFNVVQKRRRALIAERKRQIHGDPLTAKLKNKQQPLSVSGKRKRKLVKKWRREQKEALEKGLISMEDVEMSVAEVESQDVSKTPKKIHLKKNLKVKQLRRRDKNKRKSAAAVPAHVPAPVPVAEGTSDAMEE